MNKMWRLIVKSLSENSQSDEFQWKRRATKIFSILPKNVHWKLVGDIYEPAHWDILDSWSSNVWWYHFRCILENDHQSVKTWLGSHERCFVTTMIKRQKDSTKHHGIHQTTTDSLTTVDFAYNGHVYNGYRLLRIHYPVPIVGKMENGNAFNGYRL